MARKKDSAVKQMHATADPWDQYLISRFGPRYLELKGAVDVWTSLLRHDDYDRMDDWIEGNAVKFFERILSEARNGNGKFLRQMAEVAELKNFQMLSDAHQPSQREKLAEPWRGWLVANYKILVASDTEGGECVRPLRRPAPIQEIQQLLADLFKVHLDDRKLRSELKAMGIPFARSKRGRRPAKPARGKKSS